MSIVFSILVLIGIIISIFSFYQLYKSFKNENTKQRNYALIGIAIGVILCLSPLLLIVFGFLFGGSYHE